VGNELVALRRATRVLLDDTLTACDRLQAIADLLPGLFRFPDSATASVRYGDEIRTTAEHATTAWVLTSWFETSDGVRGELEVAYHDVHPLAQHGPFLAEEAELLASLGELLCGSIDRGLATAAMREANERLNLALDTAGMGFWEWDLRRNRVRWSRQLAAMAGLEGEQVGEFLEFSHFVHDDDRDGLRSWLENAASEEITRGRELRLRRADGGWRPLVAHTGRVRDEDGKPIRLLASLFDLTERRALEEGLRHAQRLDAIGQVAGGVAHDFNNLLTVLMTGVDVIRASAAPDHPWRAQLDDMHHAVESAAALTRQLLAFSRHATFQAEAVDLSALVRRMQSLLQRLAGKQMRVELALDPAAGSVWADPTQLEQVLMNLVVNARDAVGDDGGMITVAITVADAELVARAGLAAGRYALVSVEDTGPGIPPEIVGRVLEPFFTTKEPGRGTGLGLAVVSSVARQWNGAVVIDSPAGAGATFHVLFPQLAA
jgi:PAS domain S-box-containing protein